MQAIKAIEKSGTLAQAIGDFVREWDGTARAYVRAAQAYKRAIELGADLSEYISPQEGQKLLAVADNKLIESAEKYLPVMPLTTAARLVTLPKAVQKQLIEDGADIVRDGEVVREKVQFMAPGEVKRLVDVLDGKGRILTPAEQQARIVPVARHDKEVPLRLSPEVFNGLASLAGKSGKSLKAYILDILKREIE